MATRRNLRLAAIVQVIVLMIPNGEAREAAQAKGTALTAAGNQKRTGILTDRLKKSQLKAWKSILAVVLARDKEGRLLHPRLHELYQQAEASGRRIRIELSTHISPCGPVAWFKTSQDTAGTEQEPVVIRLNLGLIDKAVTSPLAGRINGFIPFAGLKKKERYAEALGHELAHAVRYLVNAEYMGYYHEVDRLRGAPSGRPKDEAIERLISLIEKPAESAELEIWQELRGTGE